MVHRRKINLSTFKKNILSYMKGSILLFASLLTGYSCSIAQTISELSSSEIVLNLKKLNTVGSVLYVAAHPDDENTRLLGYLSKEKKLRTAYLSLTRGDGGQNLIGKEQGELLGLIRTQELLAARRTDGAEQFFSRSNDFGYSKNPEETFAFWDRDSVLADAVWIIRTFKPDVIICRFPTTGEGGHGHHTASAIIALEAFDAAADPTKFPSQLKYTEVWQAKRIFWNTFNFGGTNTTSSDQLKIDVGIFNPLLGKSFGEIAAESRSMHKSQGFGSSRQRGSNIEYFKLLKGDPAKNDVFENIDFSWGRFAGTKQLDKLIADCIFKFDLQAPEKTVPALIQIYNALNALPETDPGVRYWKNQKLKETTQLILSCSGLWLEASTAEYTGIPGNDMWINAQIISRNKIQVQLNKITFLSQTDTLPKLALNYNELYTFKHKEKLSAALPYSNPYWLNEKHEPGRYKVNDQRLVGKPENNSATNVVFDLDIQGLNLKIQRDLVYKNTDPVKGEVYRPFEVLPPATVNISEKVIVFSDAQSKNIQVLIKANAANISGRLMLKAKEGWNISIPNPEFKLANKGDEAIIAASITPDKATQDGKLSASLEISGNSYNKSIQRIEYDHIPYQFNLSDAEASLVNIDLKKVGTSIGYIAGAGDDVPTCLKQIGYTVTILTDELLSSSDLSKYDAIVTGVRAYNTNDRLQVHYSKLMEYVNKGGNLIVQYNTNSRIGPVLAKIGPYPFTISRDRVTDEKAEVRVTNKNHPALNFPNSITPKDFENWIQERGIYFATDIDKNYETVLAMNDTTEKTSDGSLIISKYGKGNFVYTGLVFFRELPAGIPGAYRLFANLLSLPPNN
jgi:LmbE family N-acetylglucosaminyl deacetylase